MSEKIIDEGKKQRDELRQKHAESGDYCGWFEELYSQAEFDEKQIPWAKLVSSRALVTWLDHSGCSIEGGNALVVGCGLGDDAEEISSRGFTTTAFDISSSALEWCMKRFPQSEVRYLNYNLFETPNEWCSSFDFVFEANTLQSLPIEIREAATKRIADFVKPGGILFLSTFGRDHDDEPPECSPWPLSLEELEVFNEMGLAQMSIARVDLEGKRELKYRYNIVYRKEI